MMSISSNTSNVRLRGRCFDFKTLALPLCIRVFKNHLIVSSTVYCFTRCGARSSDVRITSGVCLKSNFLSLAQVCWI